MEPAPEGSAAPRWSHKQALAVITKGDPDGGKTHAWFGYYQGHPGWLAITNDAHLAIPGGAASVPARGHRIAAVADGEVPVREFVEVDAAGKAPPPNIAPHRTKYNARLHVTYITPGAAEVASTPGKWMVEPAPRSAKPGMSAAAARTRSHATVVDQVDARSTRVYFGLFTGRDLAGAVRAKAPAWLVVGRRVRVNSQAPGSTPEFAYAVTAFSDDLTQPWVSGRLLVRRPFVF